MQNSSQNPNGLVNDAVETYLEDGELPESFPDETALEEFMTRPTRALAKSLNALSGDIMVLGV
ncbi:hypothetical protein MNBD_ALPHA04-2322, partial [hydrothermal vent metagenome]